MKYLDKEFQNRDELIKYVRELAPWSYGHESHILGGRSVAEEKLAKIDLSTYEETRNYGDGNVTRLSPYIHHGIFSLNEIRNHVLEKYSNTSKIEKFIQELAWRDFWQYRLSLQPDSVWTDIEPYKTGYSSNDYSDELPLEITNGKTNTSCINSFIHELIETGYIHNHARMYLASYIVHFRRIKWQAGAKWFLQHLLDGDVASNNLSWQWVASTFSHKPYIFNLENVEHFFGKLVDTNPLTNKEIDFSYEELKKKLFPNIRNL